MADSRAYEFTMNFVSTSDKYRQQFVDKWEEVMSNFMVTPDYDNTNGGVKTPYRRGKSFGDNPSQRNQVVLKDFETHKAVMTYASKLARSLFGDMHHEYVRARPSGWEDWQKGRTATRLLRYTFGLEGHFRTFVEALVDMLIFGTAIIESPWKYEERSILSRTVTTTPYGMLSDFQRVTMPTYDDVCLRNIDPMDFYPDPSRYRLYEMSGYAKRFRMNSMEARRMKIYDQTAVEKAISKGSSPAPENKDSFRRGLDQPTDTQGLSEFKPMVGYEYWGDVPDGVPLRMETGKLANSNETGGRGVITILNGEVVRNDVWPLADYCLPAHAFIINPVNGRFYGVSPAEVIRWDQSFADAMKILVCKAAIRQVHPPIAYDSDADFDPAKLREWRADLPIPIRGGPSAIGTLRYDANLPNGMSVLNSIKAGIQEGSGALGAIQGQDGPDREAATVGSQRLQFAMDRPELAAMVIENECLPPLAKGVLRRCQQFVEDDESLQRRIGMEPETSLSDIMGDFEVEFIGSRMSLNRQQKLQAYQTLASLAPAFPALQLIMPTQELAKELVGDMLELPEVASAIGSAGQEQNVMQNAAAMQLAGGRGPAGNGVPQQPQPPGMLPAQAAGS